MQVIVLATEEQKAQFGDLTRDIIWIKDVYAFGNHASADAFVDLTFEPTEERVTILAQLLPKPVIINCVAHTLPETHADFVRINGWATFLSSPFWEATCLRAETKQKAEMVFALLDKQAEWLPDLPGFVTARVISAVINEAFLALAEGVSTKEEINTAMKLGTAYPYGPFDWAAKIGLKNILRLLQKLRQLQPYYSPATLMVKEVSAAT